MSLLNTPKGLRLHIGLFGKRNAGKSSLINALTNQTISIVSNVPGTTTDPVEKACEFLPIGPVVFIDTAGVDDVGDLGLARVKRSLSVLEWVDMALIVTTPATFDDEEKRIIERPRALGTPAVLVVNRTDEAPDFDRAVWEKTGLPVVFTSARERTGLEELRAVMVRLAQDRIAPDRPLVGDLAGPGDTVILVTPIDTGAPKGRLILPQQQTIRSLLDAGCIPVVTRETELARTLSLLREPPALVVTDSQAFGMVSRNVPDSVRLTSFSILFARYKGDLRTAVLGAAALRRLKDGDTVLISESCTHHRQCGDIGTEKLPRWVRQYTGRDIRFVFTSGGEFPENLSPYALIIHCGACMLGEREMQSRLRRAAEQCIPVTNYGIAIAQIHGILDRALRPFSALHAEWEKQQQ